MKKKIVVLMSAYNGEEYIHEQIESILAQEGSFEMKLWVRDDGSQDRTVEILQEYEKKQQLILVRGENLKSAKSFLQLLKVCEEGDYYAFADQDDYWFPNKLEKAIEMLGTEEKPQIYFSNAELVDSKLQGLNRVVYRREPAADLYTVMCAPNVLGCTMVYNHEAAKLIRKKAMPKTVSMHDSYLAGVCMAVGGKIIYHEWISMKYRQHDRNVIGIKHNYTAIIRQRLKEIFTEADIGIDQQAGEILKNYAEIIPVENKGFIERVENYKKSILSRLALACSRKPKYITKNMAFTIRMSIFFGNR
ncbi:MAG: glycosyltransferase family 2 protein [Lachnospiraceae bacterium]